MSERHVKKWGTISKSKRVSHLGWGVSRKALGGNKELTSWRFEDEGVFCGAGTECPEVLS